MDFQEINRIVLSLLNSFGGGAVVVGVLSGWLGKIQANRIHEKDKYGFQKSLNEIKSQYEKDIENIKQSNTIIIENYRSQLEIEVMKSNLYNQTQFERCNDIYSTLIDLKIISEELWNTVDNSYLTKFSKQLKKAHTTLQKGRLLLDEDDYQAMISLITHFDNFRVGKKKLLEFRNQSAQVLMDVHAYEERSIVNENFNELKELRSLLESISLSIKNRLKGNI